MRVVLVLLAAAVVACGGDGEPASTFDAAPTGTSAGSSSGSDASSDTTSSSGGSEADTSSTGSVGDSSSGEPLFTCDAVASDSPTLAADVRFDPADPHPGDTLTVIVRATNGLSRAEAPPMALSVTSRDGTTEHPTMTIEGGEALYYYAIPDLPLGDVCLLGSIDGQPEVGAKVTVTPRPPSPPIDGGIFKVTSNHMWTCDEQPDYGNELHVWVRDEDGNPMAGRTVALALADTTDLGSIYNGDTEALPTEVVTGDDGHAQVFDYWPISDTGLLVFEISIDGVASDIATEITTGWWEDDLMGCNYCNRPTVNVWGHWSYTIEFQRDPSATEACVVENDHAGMAACGEPRHIHHHPTERACWSVE